MELNDIIKNDDDRLFIITPECFIVFTGDSIEDEKPFIRIGNSLSLTPRIIPLIENIIITDLITGNPAHEQFNIDPRYLSSNRYIGSKLIVKRYLEYQKLFGLDLHNATIVDIEEDIPELSKEQIISDRETFLGIFYTDNNFKILHNQKILFDLKEIHQKYPGDVLVHNKLSETSSSIRFSGCGFAIAPDSILFYKNNTFSTIEFPASSYYLSFSSLQIDPANIRDTVITTANTIPLIPIVKWKNALSGRLRIFYDNEEEVKLLKKLFNRCTIHFTNTRTLACDNPEGFSIKNINPSKNCIITFKNVKPSSRDITIVYIHDPSALPLAVETPADLYLIDYDLYKKGAMLLATISPAAIISHHEAIIPVKDHIHCTPSHQYDIRCYDNKDRLLNDMVAHVDKTIAAVLQEGDIAHIEKLPFDELSPIQLCNIVQILRVTLHNTSSREEYKHIEKLLYRLQHMKKSDAIDCRYSIMLFNNYAYTVCQPLQPETTYPFELIEHLHEETIPRTDLLPDIVNRIINDRKRLNDLLELFYKKNNTVAKEAQSIEKAINKRKKETSEKKSLDMSFITREKMKRRLQWIKKAASVLLIIITALAALYGVYYSYTTYQKKIESQRQARYIKHLTQKYNIHVSDRDIFFYANDVAVKNGYSRIDIKSLKEKNPHWIYPGNRFVLLDGETIVVKPGDTLWGISEKKLLSLYITFYTIIDELEKKIDQGIKDEALLKKAFDTAISQKQKEYLKTLMQRMNTMTTNNKK